MTDAAMPRTARWCIGAAQRWLGNDSVRLPSSWRGERYRDCSIYIYCTAEWIISNEWHERLIGYAFTKYAQVRDADESVVAANVRIEDGGYVVRDANGFAVAYVYGPSTEAEAMEAKQMTMDEARRVVSNIAKLPDMLKRGE